MKTKSSRELTAVFLIMLTAMFICLGLTLSESYGASSKVNKSPEISKIVASSKSVTVYWTKTQSAAKYYVYRKNTDGKYKKIAVLSKKKRSYRDKNVVSGKQYAYKIVSKNGIKRYVSKKRLVTPVKIKTPELIAVKRYSTNKKDCAKLQWKSIKGYSYDVLRKKGNGSFIKIANVSAKENVTSYIDRTSKKNTDYTYTVRPVKKVGKILYRVGTYDHKGITTIVKRPKVTVDFTNLQASVSWSKIKGVTGYKVYRKVGLKGTYKEIADVKTSDNSCSYKDVYRDSLTTTAEKKLLVAEHFVDPSLNNLVYMVRAYYKDSQGKTSYSNYYIDGDFHIETPSIVGVTKISSKEASIEWSTAKNAKEYNLYTGYDDVSGKRHWEKVATVKREAAGRQTAKVKVNPAHPYYTVKAVFSKNGKTVYSGYDEGFRVNNRNYSNKNILYIGDSITFGSPYKGEKTKEVFSYPWRINQLTDVRYYNPSIPGATYSYKPYTGNGYHRYRLITDVAEKIRDGSTPAQALHENSQTYKDFDVVIMAAGTNDYLDDAELGSLDSSKIEEFNGAVNTIIDYIKTGSEQRIAEGKEPIKVVFVDLFYSDRTVDYSKRVNRFITKNNIGLTLKDYQADIDALVEKYREEGMDIYQFHTNEIVKEQTCPYATSDNLHMTRFTYTQIGNQLAEFLTDNEII